MITWLATGTAANSIEPISYVIGILVGVTALVGGGIRLYRRLKDRWINEGQEKNRIAVTNEANTRALAENTGAVRHLTDSFKAYAERTDSRLDHLDGRLTHLEGNLDDSHVRLHRPDTDPSGR